MNENIEELQAQIQSYQQKIDILKEKMDEKEYFFKSCIED